MKIYANILYLTQYYSNFARKKDTFILIYSVL